MEAANQIFVKKSGELCGNCVAPGEFIVMGKRKTGVMVISLDFELMWGVIDHHDIETYGKQVLGARLAVERILELFERYGIHATWAVVGFLLCKD